MNLKQVGQVLIQVVYLMLKNLVTLLLHKIVNFIKNDWKSNRIRLIGECVAMICNIGSAITLAVTIHNPNMYMVYGLFLIASLILIFCAYSRKSFGFMALYIMFVLIDGTGLTRLLLNL